MLQTMTRFTFIAKEWDKLNDKGIFCTNEDESQQYIEYYKLLLNKDELLL